MSKPENPSAWQPIETAPKNGDDIVLFDANSGGAIVASWEEDCPNAWAWMTLDGPNYHEGAFTHWMPLPPAPTQSADPA